MICKVIPRGHCKAKLFSDVVKSLEIINIISIFHLFLQWKRCNILTQNMNNTMFEILNEPNRYNLTTSVAIFVHTTTFGLFIASN